MTPSVIGIDLFGTLVSPPTGQQLLGLLSNAGIHVRSEARPTVANGFFPAMLIDCHDRTLLSKAIHLSLTRQFDSMREYVDEIQELSQTPYRPTGAEIESCQCAQELAIYATSLSSDISELLDRHRCRGVPLVLVSDVSSFWKPLVDRLELGRWFESHVLSCVNGNLKREGVHWRGAVLAQHSPLDAAVLIGDSWGSDGVCALTAGTNAILIGKSSRRVADVLLQSASLLRIDEEGRIRVPPEARSVLDAIACGLADEIEENPGGALIFGQDDRLQFRRLAGLTWMPSTESALRHLLQG